MASRSGTNLKLQQLLEAASTGNLQRFKNLAAELDDAGKGLAQTIVDIKHHKDGETALHIAVRNGNVELFKYLVDDLKLDFESKDGKGITPLHHAASEGHKQLVQALLSKGANVNAESNWGTPLIMAAGNGKHEIVAMLLTHHADPNIGSDGIHTPLSASILAPSLPCVALLIEAGADPNAVACGESPLVLATCVRETEMIKYLLKAGADPNVGNDFGLTPLELAAWKGSHQDAQILYPVTSPIPAYSDWSIGGIMGYLGSKEARVHLNLKGIDTFKERKSKGEDAFQKKNYVAAEVWYSKALEIVPNNAKVLSNRSLCWARLKDGENAVSDAEACLMFAPEWPKAYYRAGAAYTILEKFDRAVDAFSKGLKLAPKDKILQAALREAKMKTTKA